MSPADMLASIAIAVGIVGIVVPLLPGSLLVAGAVVAWAISVGSSTGWAYAAAALAVLALGTVVKYAVPGRSLKAGGIPNRTLVLGGLLGLVGFFVIPVVGLVIGFVAGVYLSETLRLGPQAAWSATTVALKAVGLSVMIELFAALVAAAVWLVGALVT